MGLCFLARSLILGIWNFQLILDQAVELIREAVPDLLAVYVFGSFGTERERPESDIDLAVLSRRKLDTVMLWNLAQKIASIPDRDVDLADMQQANTVFRYEILSDGQRIFCSNPDECDLMENAYLGMYVRFSEVRQPLIDAYLEEDRR